MSHFVKENSVSCRTAFKIMMREYNWKILNYKSTATQKNTTYNGFVSAE